MAIPVIIFAFNRPQHLQYTLIALAANKLAKQSEVTIFCDGPRSAEEQQRTRAVVEVARQAVGFRNLSVVERTGNLGLAQSVIRGVCEALTVYEEIIVLEDDLVTSPYFLLYMNEAMKIYADAPEAASVHGWCFPNTVQDPPETFFLKGADCWGWGTWKRAWKFFEPDAGKLIEALHRLDMVHAFNCNGTYNYLSMLHAVMLGRVDSWAVRWRASAFINNMYTLHPGRSLVQNIGTDGTGANFTSNIDIFNVRLSSTPIIVAKQKIIEHNGMRVANEEFNRNFWAALRSGK
jgi:hypothetical protein